MEESEYLCHPRVLASQHLVNFNAADERVTCHRRERYRAQADDMKCRRPELVGLVLPDPNSSGFQVPRPKVG